ncbi:MAG: GrpB family protein [Patescibacteria group bacterium]
MKKKETRKYDVVIYNPDWAKQFNIIERELKNVFKNIAKAIEHVGSTSIEGMSGKPTIDILVIVDDAAAVDSLNKEMEDLGYKVYGDYLKSGGRFFAKERNGERLVNVHCYASDNPKAEELLMLRDFLRENFNEAKAYADFKLDLFTKFPDDYFVYRKQKDVYMKDLLNRARSWYDSMRKL